jgi:hypothetical protein
MKFCKISLIVWIDNFICWIPVFVVPVSIVKPWNLVNHEKAYATTWTREVWSKGAVTWYNFLFGFSFQHAFCQTFQHRLVSYIHLTVWEILYCENCEKKLSHMRIKFKSWNVWTLDHSTYLCHRCRIIRKPDS